MDPLCGIPGEKMPNAPLVDPPPSGGRTPPLSGGLGVLNVALEPVESIALTIDLLLELPEEEVSVIYGETMGCDRWGEWVQCETLPARGHR